MSIERRSGAPSTRTWLLGLALGATCAAAIACSATSGSTQDQGGWPQTSGGGPLGSSSSGGSGSGSGGTASSGGGSGSSSGSSSGGSSGSSSGSPASADASTPTGGEGGALADAGSSDGSGGDAHVPGDAAPQAFTFTLIDTNVTGIVDGSPVTGFDPLAEGATINLASVGTTLSVRANVPATGSVAFAVDATYTHTENATPYMLCGDDGAGTITSCANVLTVGKHTLTATPYSAANLGGTAGTPATVDFVIVDAVDAGGQ
jgi:hypothetical protein